MESESSGPISYPPSDFEVQPVNIERFCIIAKKMRLDPRIRMHRSRASGASNLSRYGHFCARPLISYLMDFLNMRYGVQVLSLDGCCRFAHAPGQWQYSNGHTLVSVQGSAQGFFYRQALRWCQLFFSNETSTLTFWIHLNSSFQRVMKS